MFFLILILGDFSYQTCTKFGVSIETKRVMSDSQEMNKNGSNVDQPGADEEDIVNPWEVSTHSAKGVDYDKLISKVFFKSFTLVFVHIR